MGSHQEEQIIWSVGGSAPPVLASQWYSTILYIYPSTSSLVYLSIILYPANIMPWRHSIASLAWRVPHTRSLFSLVDGHGKRREGWRWEVSSLTTDFIIHHFIKFKISFQRFKGIYLFKAIHGVFYKMGKIDFDNCFGEKDSPICLKLQKYISIYIWKDVL